MPNRRWTVPARLAAALCACLLTGAAGPAHADISVGLTPADQFVAPDTDFDVYLDITSAGSPFNGFSIVLSYNPAALTLVPSVPTSLQEGCLMTGACSAACGNTFQQFVAAGDSITVNDYLFCNQVALTGPGHLYRIRFHSAASVQLANINIRRATFYNAGLFVNPVHTAGTTIHITLGLAVGDASPGMRPLRVEPNPAFGRLQLVLEDAAAGLAQADILDLQGRIVRRLGPTWLGPRARLDWDGADAGGNRAPGGIYLARVQRGGRVQTSRFVLLR